MRETLWKLPDHAFVKETVFRLAKEDPDVRAFPQGGRHWGGNCSF